MKRPPLNIKVRRIEEEAPQIVKPIGKGARYITRCVVTGKPVLDMLQLAIKYHQDNFISLRSISLRPKLYAEFFNLMNEAMVKQTEGKKELDRKAYFNGECFLCFCEVDIRLGSVHQKEDMYYEEYFKDHVAKEKNQAIFSPILRPKFND